MLAGVDGYKRGWMVAIDDLRGTRVVETFRSFGDIVSRKELRTIVIDIPIGLLDRGVRAADVEARLLLKGRSSCVFNAPIRPILRCPDQATASTIWREVEGKGCSAQGFGIVSKVAEVDDVVRAAPAGEGRIYEGHPEVTFAVMNGGTALRSRKHHPRGELERLALLAPTFGDEVECWLSRFPRYARTDVIDAFAMLWTARRLAEDGPVSRFPARLEQRDSFGVRAQIVA